MACSGAYADWSDYETFFCATFTPAEHLVITAFLELAAADIHAALAATGACDCTLASWADVFLRKLNVIDAAVFHNCPCGTVKLPEDRRKELLFFMDRTLRQLQNGSMDVCAGATGAGFPVTAWADMGSTEFAQAEIIANDYLRNP